MCQMVVVRPGSISVTNNFQIQETCNNKAFFLTHAAVHGQLGGILHGHLRSTLIPPSMKSVPKATEASLGSPIPPQDLQGHVLCKVGAVLWRQVA